MRMKSLLKLRPQIDAHEIIAEIMAETEAAALTLTAVSITTMLMSSKY